MLPYPWQARHGLTAAQYQAEFNTLEAQGYRLRYVSGYEVGGTDLYAAIWEQAPGPAWQARHGLNAAQYQAEFNALVGQGYRLRFVNGYTAGGQVLYAALWEQTPGPAWQARHGLTAVQYQQAFNDLVNQGYRLVHVSGCAPGGSPLYAAVWEQRGGPAWQARHGLDAAGYQQAFNDLVNQGYRLVHVSSYEVGGRDEYAAIWEHSTVPAWQARHGLDAPAYQQAFDDLAGQGYRLVRVSGLGRGGAAFYAGLWERHGFIPSELDAMNKVATDFMAKYDVPGMSVAIARQGRLVFAQGYGLADKAAGTNVTPSSLFRIASVTKPITSVTLFRLIEQGKLSLSDTVFGPGALLGTTYGTQPYGPNIEAITLQELMEHTGGGWPNDASDPMFSQPALSQAQLISWVLDNRPLDHVPGTYYAYSNFGYCLLGRVIEHVTGLSYHDAVQQQVLTHCGVTDMFLAGNTLADRGPGEVVYYGQGGEDPYGMRIDRMDSHGGWVATATDLARFAVHVDGFPTVPDILSQATIATMTTPSAVNANYAKGWAVNSANNWWHIGSLPGTVSVMVRTSGGFCWAALTNTRVPGGVMDGDLDSMVWNMVNAVTEWPDYDLF
jgi:CubicO group peptidase (beta-lactamase class C family)